MLEPMAAIRMNMVKVDGYTASNDAGTLTETVGDVNYHKIEAGIGGAISTSWVTNKGMMTPRASMMIYHDFKGDSMDNQVSFAGNDYTLKGATAEKTSYEAHLGVDMDSGENTTVTMGYTRVMKSGFSSNNFSFRLKYIF
ncbi:autotransporter outer membrane beta-barrel domain-containing protein [Endozoicomonas atrinae]|uniref:autotransporter outer membrane beta-barrel domain-containing protein n=1 Tax=Endozoicomonas atrinae TaxID=1333660 RepID=UPI003B0017C8